MDKGTRSVLIIASVASMISQFNMPCIQLLLELGYDVDVATNFFRGSTCSRSAVKKLLTELEEMGVGCHQIGFERTAYHLTGNVKAYRQLDRVFRRKEYAFAHCHSPVGGAIGRIVAKKHGVRTIYTAHGFHFYKGSPIMNWMLYYPVEKQLSRITDVLITVNREDYHRAKRNFHARRTVFIPGIGIDIGRFADTTVDRTEKRRRLGISEKDIMLFSVGELNKNKNHETVIRAIADLKKTKKEFADRLHYFIAGRGFLHDKLQRMADEFDIHLHLLGFREDVPNLLKAADVFLLPSKREGMNVGLIEALASGLPCIASDIRGNRDVLAGRPDCLVGTSSRKEWAAAIEKMIRGRKKGVTVPESGIRQYDVGCVLARMREIYGTVSGINSFRADGNPR